MRSLSEIDQTTTHGPDWAKGCGICCFGLLSPPAIKGHAPLHEERLAQHRAGQLSFCDCQAGQFRRAFTMKRDGQHISIPELVKQAKADAKERNREALWSNAGVPPLYADYTFAGYVEKAGGMAGKDEAIKAIKEYFYNGHTAGSEYPLTGIFLWGDPGVGKTGALSPLFTHLVKGGNSGLWIQYNDFLDDMRDFESGNVRGRMDACKSVDYLFIDDFGDPGAQKSATDYARDVIFRIVDHRVNNNLPMFITSNLGPAAIADQFHKRIARRLAKICATIKVSGNPLNEANEIHF